MCYFNIETAKARIKSDFYELLEEVDGDVDVAILLYKEFAGTLKAPRQPKPYAPSQRDKDFVLAYESAPCGEKQAVVQEFASKYRMKYETADSMRKRARRAMGFHIFKEVLKSISNGGTALESGI